MGRSRAGSRVWFASCVVAALVLGIGAACTPFGAEAEADAGPGGPGPGLEAGAVDDDGGTLDASGRRFCASFDGVFCDDFDDDDRALLRGAWTAQLNGGKSKLALDDTMFASSPRSLDVSVARSTDSTYDSLLYRSTPSWGTAEVSFALRLAALPTGVEPTRSDVQVLSVSDATGHDPVLFTLSATKGFRLFQENTDEVTATLAGIFMPAIVGKFVRIALRFERSREVRLFVDGVDRGTLVLPLPWQAGLEVQLGNKYAYPQPTPVQLWIDDVVIDPR